MSNRRAALVGWGVQPALGRLIFGATNHQAFYLFYCYLYNILAPWRFTGM
jgi:hypothetical protein